MVYNGLVADICEVCGKHLANRRAYAGHMLLAHGKRVGFMAEYSEFVTATNEKVAALEREVSWLASNMSRMFPGRVPHDVLIEGSPEPVRAWPVFFFRDAGLPPSPLAAPKSAPAPEQAPAPVKVCRRGAK